MEDIDQIQKRIRLIDEYKENNNNSELNNSNNSDSSHIYQLPDMESVNDHVISKLFLTSIVCLILMIAQLIGGLIAGSLAIVSDAAHLFSDLSGFFISICSMKLAKQFEQFIFRRNKSTVYSYGYHRAEIIGALASIVLIWGITIVLVYEAINRIIDQSFEIDGQIMLYTSLFGLACNLTMMKILHSKPGSCHHHGHSHGVNKESHGHSHNLGHSHSNNQGHGHSHNEGHDHSHNQSHTLQHNEGHSHQPNKVNTHSPQNEVHSHSHNDGPSHSHIQENGHSHNQGHSHSNNQGHGHSHNEGHDHSHNQSHTLQHNEGHSHQPNKVNTHSPHNEVHSHSHNDGPSHSHIQGHGHLHNQGNTHAPNYEHANLHNEEFNHGHDGSQQQNSYSNGKINLFQNEIHQEKVSSITKEYVEIELELQSQSILKSEQKQFKKNLVNQTSSSDHGQQTQKNLSEVNVSDNHNYRAAMIHIIGDVCQSIGVIIAAIIIYYNPTYKLADPICTFIFAILVIFTTVPIMQDILIILMEGSPKNINQSEFINKINSIDEVKDIHDFHIWSLSSGKPALSAHIYAQNPFQALKKCTDICRQYGIYHSTIQVEYWDLRDQQTHKCDQNIHN